MITVAPPRLVPGTKGFVLDRPVDPAAFLARSPHLFDGSFTWPLATLDASALDGNVRTMASFARDRGVWLCPHGKTTMAPAIWRSQVEAGAWGITVATPAQAMAAVAAGAERIQVAGQLLDPGALAWVARVSAAGSAEVLFWVDSLPGLRAAAAAAGPRPFQVLLEVGHAHGRTGVRERSAARELAAAAARVPGVRLVGVTGWEGDIPRADTARVYLAELRATAEELAARGLLPGSDRIAPPGTGPARPGEQTPGEEAGPTDPDVPAEGSTAPGGCVVLSAGGSVWFDLVAQELTAARPLDGAGRARPAAVLLRSGSYVVHDHGLYADRSPFTRLPGHLDPAVRVWAQVLSRPEEDLVLVGAGKRDVGQDEGLPLALRVHRPCSPPRPVRGWETVRTNDQHLFLRTAAPTIPVAGPLRPATDLAPGDVIEFGISHPCTTLDRWRVLPVLQGTRVVDLYATCF